MLRFVFVLLFAIGSVQAAYITDKLLVGFYTKPDASTQPVKVLPSSTPMEVLGTKDAFSKVRLGDGKEGWVKTIYISNEKPARAMLLELQAKSSTIQKKLRQAEKALKTTQGTKTQGTATPKTAGNLNKLQKELSQTKQRMAVVGSALKDEQKETKRLKALLKQAVPKDTGNLSKLQKELSQSKQRLAVVGNTLKDEQKETKRLKALLKKAGTKKSGNQSKQVKALKKKLASSKSELKATLHEARLLQDLLKKTDQTASLRIAALEQEVIQAKKGQAQSATSDRANYSALIEQNAIMKQRLQQVGKILGAPLPEIEEEDDSGFGSKVWVFLIALLLSTGIVGGIIYKNKNLRRRYGRFHV